MSSPKKEDNPVWAQDEHDSQQFVSKADFDELKADNLTSKI